MVNVAILASVTAVFMAVTIYLGWYGYRSTKDNGQFLLGKNKANPVLIALSYGATFISTSAIAGSYAHLSVKLSHGTLPV